MPKRVIAKKLLDTISYYFGSDDLQWQNRIILPNDQDSFGQNIRLFLDVRLRK